ncbi:MAG: sensor histidine kinase [Acidimicrobiia bacterium]
MDAEVIGQLAPALVAALDRRAVAALVLDPEGTVCWASAAGAALLGTTADELTGRPGADVIPPTGIEVIPLEAPLAGGHLVVLQPPVPPDGGERLALGAEAHDLNNLLTVILGLAGLVRDGLVRDGLGPDHPLLADVEGLRDAARRGADLARRLTASGRPELAEPPALDVAAVVDSMKALLERTVPASVEVVVDHDGIGAEVRVDRTLLERVVLNLVVNARDAMPAGGTVAVRTSCGDGTPEPVVVLSVSDTGQGIPPEVLDRVFEPFFTTKPAGLGTGLGLTAVNGIVAGAGGTVALESTVGVGTTVRIVFPRGGPCPTPSR